MAYHNLADLHWQGDSPAASLALNGRGLDLAVRRGLGLSADWLRANRAQVCFDAGRWDEVLDLTAIVLGHEALTADGQAGTSCEVCAARVRLWRGDVEGAQRGMERFLPSRDAMPSPSSWARHSSWPGSSRRRRATQGVEPTSPPSSAR